MNRYAYIELYKTEEGRTYQGTTRYPEIPLSEDDIYVYTADGDRLDKLALEYYRDPSLYWIILAANPTLPFSTLYPTLGVQIRIPADPTNVINKYNLINNV